MNYPKFYSFINRDKSHLAPIFSNKEFTYILIELILDLKFGGFELSFNPVTYNNVQL